MEVDVNVEVGVRLQLPSHQKNKAQALDGLHNQS